MSSASRRRVLQAIGSALLLTLGCSPDKTSGASQPESSAPATSEEVLPESASTSAAGPAGAFAYEPETPAAIPAQEALPAEPLEPPPPSKYPRPCADIYDEDLLPTFEVEISEDDWDDLRSDFRSMRKEYRPITFKYGDEVFPDAMIRIKGNNSECEGKMQFSIAFHRKNEHGRFHGLRRISLDHGGCHLFEERLVMSFARDLGLPALCVNHARLVINGEYYGLFINLEAMNKDFLKRNFEEHDGNLYKKAEELKTNEENNPDTSDIADFLAADDLEDVEALLDIEQAISVWAFEAVMPAQDNYVHRGYNFYVYNHPIRGFLFLPYDMDQGMPSRPGDGTGLSIWPSFHHPADIVLGDSDWEKRYEAEVRRIATAFDPEEFERRLDRWWLQVREANDEDPDFVYTESRFVKLKAGIRERAKYLERYR